MGDEIRLDEATEGLGLTWELFNNTYKPYPTGVVFHSAIDASLMLHERIRDPAAVSEIVLSGHQLLSDRGDRVVHTPADARVSAQHCIAATLVRGRCTLAEFDELSVTDPAIAALRDRIRVVVDPQAPLGGATLRVSLEGGEQIEVRQEVALGSLDRPLSDSDLEQKFLQNCKFSAWEPGDLAARMWHIDRQSDIVDLLRSWRAAV
jgi:2-methylcitrate dehydratase PrpD